MTPQRYIYTGGRYRQFRGYVFWDQKPVTVTDRGTLEAIKREKGFEIYEEVTHGEERKEAAAQRPVLSLKKPWGRK